MAVEVVVYSLRSKTNRSHRNLMNKHRLQRSKESMERLSSTKTAETSLKWVIILKWHHFLILLPPLFIHIWNVHLPMAIEAAWKSLSQSSFHRILFINLNWKLFIKKMSFLHQVSLTDWQNDGSTFAILIWF